MDDIMERIRQQNMFKERENRERQLMTADHALDAQLHHAAPPRQVPLAAMPDVASLEHSLLEQEQNLQRQLEAEQQMHRQPSYGRPPRTRMTESKRSAIPMIPASQCGVSPPATGRSSRPVHFTHQMTKESALPGPVASVLNPIAGGIRGEMRRAGVEPKNHLREQRQHIQNLAVHRQEQASHEQAKEDMRKQRDERIKDAALSRAQHRLTEGRPRARREAQPITPPEGPVEHHHSRGRVPSYLQRRKAEWAAQAQAEADIEAARAECPPGLRLVPAEEKAQIMATLSVEKEKAEAALRALPFVIRTQASQLKKDQLENRLLEIEGAIQAYSKERVLVPADS